MEQEKKTKKQGKQMDGFVNVKIDEDWAFAGLFGWNADQRSCLACLPKSQHLNAKIPLFVTYAAKKREREDLSIQISLGNTVPPRLLHMEMPL